MLIPESHSWVAVSEQRHDRSLGNASHRERARSIMSEIVKAKVS